MDTDRLLTFYLHSSLRRRAEAGRHNFINKISDVARAAGFDVAFDGHGREQLLRSAAKPGFAMFHMADPFHDRALTMRKVYQYPFWAIERTAKRWDWPVARAEFDRPLGNDQEIKRFYRFWQRRQFGQAAAQPERNGFVYVPLQGRLLDHRSFQCCSPIQMIEHVLEQDPQRPVVATLHPKEDYTDSERSALALLCRQHPRLTVRTGDMQALLQGCDYVVTQNSSAAFFGYFFAKPAILFAQVDFHHIATNVMDHGVQSAFRQVWENTSDYAAYIYWFWQQCSINAGLDSAEVKIRERLLAADWPV